MEGRLFSTAICMAIHARETYSCMVASPLKVISSSTEITTLSSLSLTCSARKTNSSNSMTASLRMSERKNPQLGWCFSENFPFSIATPWNQHFSLLHNRETQWHFLLARNVTMMQARIIKSAARTYSKSDPICV